MKEEIKEPMFIYCDNTSAINISKNLLMHSKKKHISIKYHFLRELVQDREVRLEYVNTKFEMSMFGEIKFFVGLQIQQN